ncbi:MAG TPA: CDP-diacylglycerol--serine O-phosphatidyltransferase [Methylomirabilota bacterium]|jgi:CDP-diacylglycerol--serine O-phosphatidyltransferase|nr:CDP-diacylglycerol--serine O-phosphatidyltransferase [Methylomirabilota bacterium]
MTSAGPHRRHFSMIRGFHLGDLFTIANGCCGVAAVFEAMKFLTARDRRHLYAAAFLIPVALVFDVLDGRIARWRHEASPMGRELDSLADVISFGVAPAAIAFAAGLNSPLDQIVLLYFAACGLSRLARYNVTAEALSEETGKVNYFEGTPIPTSVVPLGILMLAFYSDNLYPIRVLGIEAHLVTLLFFASGSFMISKTLRIPKP